MKRLYITLIIIFCFAKESISQIDYWADLVYFGGNPVSHIPTGISIPNHDDQSRLIINALISGASDTKLKTQFHDSLEIKIARLVNGDVIRKKENHYEVTFPVITGKQRAELKHIIYNKVKDLMPSITDSLVAPLGSCLVNNPEMIFHFLWSRVIDECWWDLYNKVFKTNEGPPCIAFIVYPLHPFQCGTNFDDTPDDGQIAISWSYDLFSDFHNLPNTTSFYNAMMNHPISEQDKKFFVSHDLVSSNNISNIFTYHEGDKIDSTCYYLKKRYIDLISGLFDYKELSKKYDIPADDFFILMSHEIAYEIFELLQKEKPSLLIPIKKENNPMHSFRYLVSIELPKH